MFKSSRLFLTWVSKISVVRQKCSSTLKTNKVLTISDIPHPRPMPLFGTKLEFYASGRGANLHGYVDKRHKKLGPIFVENFSGTNLVFISDPVLIKNIFMQLEGQYPLHILPEAWLLHQKLYNAKRGILFMDGEEWLTHRRVLNKYLLKENADSWISDPIRKTINDYMEKNKLQTKLECQLNNNLESSLYMLSIEVVISVLLGHNTTVKSNCYANLIEKFSNAVKKIFSTTTALYGLPVTWYQKLGLKKWNEFKESVDDSLFLVRKLVQEMISQKENSNGLIKMLMKEKISEEIIIRLIGDFIMAAGDTTSYTTMWTLYLLSRNQETIYEYRKSLTKDSARASLVLRGILKESMRMYPVAPFLTRILPKDNRLGEYHLNAATPLIASLYTAGRSDKYFSNPTQFLPYRWDRNDPRKANLKNHVPSASLPFAMGSRSCVGKKIALIQLEEIISQILNNYDIECLTTDEIKPVTSQVLVPEKPLNLQFTARI